MQTPTRFFIPTVTCLAALVLSGCGATPTAAPTGTAETGSASTQNTTIAEASSPSSRLALTYDGGIMIIDGKTFEVLTTIDKEGFLRLQPAGDNRHLVVADGSSYTMLDLGAWTQEHGDHDHYYTTTPTLTQLTFPADKTGHVISGHGKAAMFADGTGSFEVYNPAQLTDESQNTTSSLDTHTITLPAAHHGFAIPLADDRYLVSVGTEESRTGAAVIDTHGNVLAENNNCPGIHGEAHAANDTYTLGCQDGALI